ncbi:MAG: DUF3732 domain-containing protein [Candidatus Marinimicrobia bacterium]|nr:DUF3732 domain-containing protein [Candidatus Neomarinimicrobiota bacterium]
MKLSILKIILWPKDKTKEQRIIQFKEGCINVITGDSKTGKSSITWIIDYCLGSGKCSIPVGMIRKLTDWFGIHLKLANTEMLIVRRNPGEKQSTNEIYWDEGITIEIPYYPQKNGRVEDIVNRFNQISRLPSLDFKSSEQVSGYGSRPSFRDMAAFNFQPQHIVANPFTLYYKADTTEHREKLKIIFPLVFGAIDSETLAKQRQLTELEAQARKVQRDLATLHNANRVWEGEIQSYYLQAKEYGLISSPSESTEGWSIENYISELRKATATIETLDVPKISDEAIAIAAKEIAELIHQEDESSRQIGIRRRRLTKIDALANSVSEYIHSLSDHKDRLSGIGWLEKKLSSNEKFRCPLCNTVHPEAVEELMKLSELATHYKDLTKSLESAPAKLDKEEAELRTELKYFTEQLDVIREKRKELEDKSEELAALRQQTRQIFLFIGRIQQALKNYQEDSIIDELQNEYRSLHERITKLRKQLDPKQKKVRLQRAISIVSKRIAEYSKILELEHWSEDVTLNEKELTLQFTSVEGRRDFLWEIGSGANWMGYHIATFLSLHEYFLTLKNNLVPTFLIFDQPSQVYYPEKWPENEKQQEIQVPDDIAGVRRVFTAMDEAILNTSGDLQIIVTEHAGSNTWRHAKSINFIGNWRKGEDEFLIPRSWVDS